MSVSQFLHYQGSYSQQLSMGIFGGGGDYVRPDLASGTAIAHVQNKVAGVSGWTLHSHAWLILVALLFAFALNLKLGNAWKKWRYWAAVCGMAVCLIPTSFSLAPPGFGFILGLIAVAIAVWAARLHDSELKKTSVSNSTASGEA